MFKLIAVGAMLLLAPALAFADMCGGFFSVGQTLDPCTVGDLTFSFSNMTDIFNNEWTDPGSILLTPNTGGFQLTFATLMASSMATAPQGEGSFDFSYTVSSSSADLIDSEIKVSPFVSTGFQPGATDLDSVSALVYVNGSYLFGASQAFGQPLTVGETGPNPIVTSSPPVQSLSGNLDLIASDDSFGNELGYINLDLTVGVTFTEVVVPEPRSVILLATALVFVVLLLRGAVYNPDSHPDRG